MDVLRTPDERFAKLPDFPYEPRYVELDGLRMHYIDEGPPDGRTVLLLHGEPTWSFLYRKMITVFTGSGLRAVAPDLIGFGRSDKLPRREQYTFASHLGWVNGFLDALDLHDIVLFGQDWGGLLGLRIAAERSDLFTHIVAANTFLPTGDQPPSKGFEAWKEYSQTTPDFRAGGIVKGGCHLPVSDEVQAAYDAPFPSDEYLEAARQFPMIVPVTPDDPESEANRTAWKSLRDWTKPFLCLFGEHDAVLGRADKQLIENIPGAEGQPHQRFEAGHFIQEDVGEDLARAIVAWLR